MAEPADAGTAVGWTHSDSLPAVLAAAGCSLLVSTYQAGQLVGIGVANDKMTFSFRHFQRAMGVAVDPPEASAASGPGDARDSGISVGSRDQVWKLRPARDLASRIPPAGTYDAGYLPRSSTFTGNIQSHEIAWGTDEAGVAELWVVNTAFSCLVGLHPDVNFVPRWRPPFITELTAEDRCHLNGLAMRGGRPGFVTMMAPTDRPRGWRELPKNSGVVLDVPTGEVVTAGLTMPHSPRWHEGSLYVLNSGLGHLQRVDLDTGRRDVVAAMPGYTRGLAIHDGLAFVGLSRIRETAVFGEVPLAEFHDQLKCGIGVVDLSTGTTVATLEFTSAVEEIFDVQVLPGVRSPALSGPGSEEIWVASAPQRPPA
ncbi:TIGR03032 family protein [Nocardioides sp. L-11A]|uniref:TIGR03032 family protein n=1 Tax=Nocardioides sp. L-11A TaxID=3043848 RepID=UPI00249B9060|nr:TIGR03032 family protein [Nocardioides sp. L-11A]